MTLTEFLLARIAEDEAVASAVAVLVGPTTDGRPQYRSITARVLAECAAKRAIVDRAWAEIDSQDPPRVSAVFATGVLLVLAAVYADHADYNPAWGI